ncbi:unnamed protein product [Miscanthus lutarioriparius]|uniref:Uncharacterized protein n=1 Tax=Miscanthus lutarioriparius TaxID=422564 RepID=A0A811MZH5_9POAL|nr:unnamed protein product [Miscanthus lutarioriparius]
MADAAELARLLCPRAPPRLSLPQSSVYSQRPQSLLRALPRLRPPICLRCRALDASRPVAVEGERDEEDGLEDEEESYFSVTSSGLSEVDYLGESTRGDLNVWRERLEALGGNGKSTLHGPIEEIAWKEHCFMTWELQTH